MCSESLAKRQGLQGIIKVLEKSSFIKNFLVLFQLFVRTSGWISAFLGTQYLHGASSCYYNMYSIPFRSYMMKGIIKLRAWYLRRELEVRVLITYWSFLLLNVWLVSTIAGSIFKVLEDAISSPGMHFYVVC